MNPKIRKFIKKSMEKQMKTEFKIICNLLNSKKERKNHEFKNRKIK